MFILSLFKLAISSCMAFKLRFFFFKQKTAYEMRISYWSSDLCSSDLVDGLFICLPDDFFAGLSLAEYLGLQPRFTDNNRTGGSAFMSHMATAALALSAGYIDVALIAYGSNQRTAGGQLSPPFKNNDWAAPYRRLFHIERAYGRERVWQH